MMKRVRLSPASAAALASASWLLPASASAGPPPPNHGCNGSTTAYCSNGKLSYHCCPPGARCNYRYEPYVDCGSGACVTGRDEGRCVPPQPQVAATKGDCPTGWADACVNHQVTKACIAPVPTNYTGPSPNPAFRLVPGGRCTTSRFLEDALAVKGTPEAGDCKDGTWRKVCLYGKLAERCVPKAMPSTETLAATTYVDCPGQGCAVGKDRSACDGLE